MPRLIQTPSRTATQLGLLAWLLSGTLALGQTVPSQTTVPDQVSQELLKNYMASMTYDPKRTELPPDETPVPLASLSPALPALPDNLPSVDVPEIPVPAHPAKHAAKIKFKATLHFTQPVANAVLSSPFGMRWGQMHEGVDLAVPMGTPIHAAESGVVAFSGWESGYGNFVIINHGNGVNTRYGHASKLLVHAGQVVKQGQTIALVGSTGHSTGPHLHFEVVTHSQHQNPLAYLGHSFTLAADPSYKPAFN